MAQAPIDVGPDTAHAYRGSLIGARLLNHIPSMNSSHMRTRITFLLLLLAVALVFVLDLLWGAVSIPLSDVWGALAGEGSDSAYSYIVRHYRLPKALTALSAGAGIATAGLQMQSLFRNPLADTSILGINSGAGLGVAIYTMAAALMPGVLVAGSVASMSGIVLSASLGASAVLLLIAVVSTRVREVVSVLIVGVMVGFLASALISVLQFFSDEETLRVYLVWSFGSVSGTTWSQLAWMLPIVGVGLGISLLMPKYMNALALGDDYARSLGVRVALVRLVMILVTSLITGCITAFVGPVAFLGLAVPHFVRLTFGTSDHRTLLPATMLMGALLLLLCDMATQLPGAQFILPINALTSFIGAPIVILVVLRSQRRGTFR